MSSDDKLRKGQWSLEEDECLKASVTLLGERRWDTIAKATGLKRSGKSCRLRWLNYLRPSLKHSPISVEEEQIILRLHKKWGNKWARIARRLPGRTDNEIKNYWRGCLRKKTSQLIDQTEDNANAIQGNSASSWNSDDDESDYNDIMKEMSTQGDGKSEEASPSDDCVELQDVLMAPQSPYESHFSNWVWMLKSENEMMSTIDCFHGIQDDEGNNISNNALDCWDRLWDMDLFACNN